MIVPDPGFEVIELPDPDRLVVLEVDQSAVKDAVVLSIDDLGAPDGAPGATSLDDLDDVDAPPFALGLLERGQNGRVVPISREAVIAPHVADLTPHPAYDDLPSLALLLENRLV